MGSLVSMPKPVNQTTALEVDGVRSFAGAGGGCASALHGQGHRAPPATWPATWPVAVLGRLAAWLLPPRCLLCGLPGAGGLDLCPACRGGLPRLPPACPRCALPAPEGRVCAACLARPPLQAHTAAAFLYASPVDRLLPRLKFHADLAAGRLLSRLALPAFAAAPRPQALLPLPLHRARLRRRGFDQALELARPLARALGLPLLTGGLRRQRATAAQSELDARERRRNVRGAFAVPPGVALPAHLALFDDVMTTGATLGEAARVLHAAGVRRVDLWALARAPPPG